ncbi:hypothetical protein S40288_03351 [Stachybotrys chartarum IBT 40288]|nr:hypothetical protein S40288_03351 [Stachybotrys chartarum IBT 40288]
MREIIREEDVVETDEENEIMAELGSKLLEDENWRSTHVGVMLDVLNRHRDMRLGDAFIVTDERVFFLDILTIAFENTGKPVPALHCDGRMDPDKRNSVLGIGGRSKSEPMLSPIFDDDFQ